MSDLLEILLKRRSIRTYSGETIPTEKLEYLRNLLGYPKNLRLEAILSLGMYDVHKEPHSLSELKTEKIHYEKF